MAGPKLHSKGIGFLCISHVDRKEQMCTQHVEATGNFGCLLQ